MLRRLFPPCAALAAFLLVFPMAASAQSGGQVEQPTLKVGDKAPPLGKGQWVKGEPVKEFESGKVYVIENWATWCGPCIAAIPHVTEIQKKYADKGLIVIGQNVWETATPAEVEAFVDKMGEKMDYRVVMDEPSGQEGHMAKTWLAAAGQDGIPCAFVVDQKGHIAWIGHPMSMEPVIQKVLEGKYDAKAEADKQRQMEALQARAMAALQDGNVDEAMTIADEAIKLQPEMAGEILMFKFEQYAEAGRWEEAYKQADEAVGKLDDAQALNRLSWLIVDPESTFAKKDLDVAMKAANKANELTKGKDAAILDTVARVHFLKGDKAKALELQKKAVELAEDPELKRQLEETLKEYQ